MALSMSRCRLRKAVKRPSTSVNRLSAASFSSRAFLDSASRRAMASSTVSPLAAGPGSVLSSSAGGPGSAVSSLAGGPGSAVSFSAGGSVTSPAPAVLSLIAACSFHYSSCSGSSRLDFVGERGSVVAVEIDGRRENVGAPVVELDFQLPHRKPGLLEAEHCGDRRRSFVRADQLQADDESEAPPL